MKNTFVDNFYRLTDDPNAHSEYASQFLPDATLIVNHVAVQGEKGIISLRNKVWSLFSSQKHAVEVVVYSQKSSTRIGSKDYTTVEAALFGTVAGMLKNEKQQIIEWAARAEYVSQNNIEWHVWRYQVYVLDLSSVRARITNRELP